jgi:hypothetical protein
MKSGQRLPKNYANTGRQRFSERRNPILKWFLFIENDSPASQHGTGGPGISILFSFLNQ